MYNQDCYNDTKLSFKYNTETALTSHRKATKFLLCHTAYAIHTTLVSTYIHLKNITTL